MKKNKGTEKKQIWKTKNKRIKNKIKKSLSPLSDYIY